MTTKMQRRNVLTKPNSTDYATHTYGLAKEGIATAVIENVL